MKEWFFVAVTLSIAVGCGDASNCPATVPSGTGGDTVAGGGGAAGGATGETTGESGGGTGTATLELREHRENETSGARTTRAYRVRCVMRSHYCSESPSPSLPSGFWRSTAERFALAILQSPKMRLS